MAPRTRNRSNRQPGPFLMRGGIVSVLASLVRLGDHSRERTSGVSAPHAKRVLADRPGVTEEKRTAIVRNLVDGLFPAELLQARGLSAEQAGVHNERVLSALEAALAPWDTIVANLNHIDQPSPKVLEFLIMATGLTREVVVRVAAYHVLYGRLYPAFACVTQWAREQGLRACFRGICSRARIPVKVDPLRKAAGISRNTLKALRDGSSIPQGLVIRDLAMALAEHDIRDHVGARSQTSAEIEFELRIACATAERSSLSRDLGVHLDVELAELSFLRERLRGFERAQIEDILALGTASSHWPELEAGLRGLHASQLVQAVASMHRDSDRLHAMMARDPNAAIKQMAVNFTGQAEYLREVEAALGCKGPMSGMGKQLDHMAWLLQSIAGDKTTPEPEVNREELKSDSLCFQALAPWNDYDDDQKEALFQQAVAICPTAFALQHLAIQVRKRGREEEALEYLRLALRHDPGDTESRAGLALALTAAERYAEALEILDGAGEWGASSPTSIATRGWCLVRLGRAAEAEEMLRELVRTNGHYVLALRSFAECRRAQGDEHGARELERKADFYATGK